MFSKILNRTKFLTLLPTLFLGLGLLCISPAEAQTKARRTTSKQRTTQTAKAKQTTPKKGSAKSSGKGKAAAKSQQKPETAEQMRRRQQDTQREIQLTQEQIRKNEAEVKKNLGELNRIAVDVNKSRQQVASLQQQVDRLDKQIADLDSTIQKNEAELNRLRDNYLKAVKKMRAKKGKQSSLAFVFASESFNQAMRRMRYLRQFGDWRDKQSKEIAGKVADLKRQQDLLAQSKREKDAALGRQQAAERQLAEQHARQDAIVVQLRKNGDALRSHLQKKQSEANQLKNSIAAAIAAEQRKAEEARKAEEKRQQAEREAAEKRAAEARQVAEANPAETPQTPAAAKKESAKKEPAKKDNKKQDKKNNGKNYADARGRQPRSTASASAAASSASTASTASTPAVPKPQNFGNFEAARGSLPRPVAGLFNVTSPFGRHPLPDLPDVMYDNPGIDAEVAQGASAQAVFTGRVTGVYKLPGYNTVVIVSHGNYYTVYGNLASPAVKVDDNVKAGQQLGRVAEDEDEGRPSIHFEVWKGRDKLNPLDWIR